MFMNSNGRQNRCQSRTKAGKPCQAAATAGGLCFFHANPKRAVELGRIGGISKRQSFTPSPEPLPKLDNPAAIRDAAYRLMSEVYSGTLDPKLAKSLAPFLNIQMRAVDTHEVEQARLRLEAKANPLRNGEDSGENGDD